jgi:hypothetical protein
MTLPVHGIVTSPSSVNTSASGALRLRWLRSLNLVPPNLFTGIPPVKARHFALEARSLDAARMLELEPQKRYTLAAALVQHQLAQCLDDLAEMFIRRVRKAYHLAR